MLRDFVLAGPIVHDGRGEATIPCKRKWHDGQAFDIVVGGARSTRSSDDPWGCCYIIVGPLTLYLSEAKARDFTWENRYPGTVMEQWHWTDYKRSGNYPMLSIEDRELAETIKQEIRHAGRVALGKADRRPATTPLEIKADAEAT